MDTQHTCSVDTNVMVFCSKHLMNHMNLLPLDSHGVDFSRVRMWSLNNWSKYYRQTLLFGALQDAQINSVFNKHCVNAQGQVSPVSSDCPEA